MTAQAEIGSAILEAIKTCPEGITQTQFKSFVMFILYKNYIHNK